MSTTAGSATGARHVTRLPTGAAFPLYQCHIRRRMCCAPLRLVAHTEEALNERREDAMSFALTSSAVHPDQPLPMRYSCDGAHLSPPLAWSGAPQDATTFTLIVDDPDAPHGIFTHWLLFNLPADTDHLDEHIPPTPHLANGAIQGRNDFGGSGYGAPCPPHGETHRYRFTLYALDALLRLPASATRQQALQAMQTHVLAQAQLVSVYRRQS